jgi:photosystem II stability/assembly factor-like uncharacterized protein
MTKITDVSPTRSNTDASYIGQSVIGRMLSIACTPDGQTLYMGSYSNLWESDDGGQNWEQLVWPQPDLEQFDAPGSLGGWCVIDIAATLGWRVEKHPRFLARLTKHRGRRIRHLDILGFGDCGVWTALGNADGSFQEPNVVIPNFGYQAGGWRVDRHPRFVVDLNGDGCADIVGFGDAGVWTALGNGDGTFQEPQLVLGNYGYQQDWRVEKHPRFLANLTHSGFADIVGFGEDGVWIALGNGDGTFSEPLPNPVLANFGYHQDWRVDQHPRFLANLTSSGLADIVGFGEDGVFTALSNGDGSFSEPNKNPVLRNFCYQQGWRVDRHPRVLARLTSSTFSDIVGFGEKGVWTALSNGDGTFREPSTEPVLDNFAYQQGWRVDKHPRFLANLTSSGFADIVGFGDSWVWTALGNGDGTFANANNVLANFSVEQGWQVDRHPRLVGSLTENGRADIVGFGDAGVWTALGDGEGGFPSSSFVLANFGYGTIVLALTVTDRVAGSRGIWRSTDGGSTWTQVHQFPSLQNLGQLQWALGSDHLVYAAGGSSLAISKNAGATFQDVFPWGSGPASQLNHVAVWQNSPADPYPAVIYALAVTGKGDGTMFLSFDGGVNWMQDKGKLPPNVGGAVSNSANSNTPNVMVISPRFLLEVYVAQNGSSGPDMLYRGDYSHFPFGDQTSSWDPPLPLPDLLTSTDTQDAGNVFLVTTQKGRGDLLFYGAQRWYENFSQSVAYVGPLYPQAGSDWHPLGAVHADLHGLLLSPDFHAAIKDGKYQPGAGTVWILSDGGIYRSTNGGKNFDPAREAMTLSSLSVAGVAVPGKGPALSLNSGDNDGFYSMNGGQNWSYQQYGGGDNDCAFADPLRSHAMLVFTPRWDTTGNLALHTRDGQTVAVYQTDPGKLPNAAGGTHDRRAVTGPPTLSDSDPSRDVWNANSFYGERGSRPIVLGLPGEDAPTQGDYIFILNPSLPQPVLVRTQNIFDIATRDEWITTATGPGQGANVYLQGPPLQNPHQNINLGVVQASGGHAATVFYVGGDNTLWTWTEGAANWSQLVPALPILNRSVGANIAVRFFVSPYQPNLIYILDHDLFSGHVKRSDDGGQTWNIDTSLETQLTWNHQIAISSNDDQGGIGEHFDLVLTDMQFDPNNPLVRFAIGLGGVFLTIDGVNWTRLLHTGALSGRPSSCYYDWISDPFDPALYVSFAGRSLMKITDLLLSPIE